MKQLLPAFIGMLSLCMFFGCDGNRQQQELVDSLNQCAYESRYQNLDTTAMYSRAAYEKSDGYDEGKAMALANLAFVEYMRMDYDSAKSLFQKSNDITRSELIRLVNDVGMMKICQVTAQNKEFYDYRGGAERRIRRIEEAEEILTPRQLGILNYARSEFHLTSCTYYNKMWQETEADSELAIVENHPEWVRDDLAQQAMMYLQQGNTFRIFEIAREKGLNYMLANAMMSFNDSIGANFSLRALQLFREYGSVYGTALAYVKISDNLLKRGLVEAALDTATKALEYVNIQHQRAFGKDTEFLYPYRSASDSISTEMHWMKSGNIVCAWEWIAEVREQLSKAYAGLGMKAQSDYNRNIYLDILEATRQDRMYEQRKDSLEYEKHRQYFLFVMIVLLSAFLLLVAYLVLKRLKRRALLRYTNEQRSVNSIFREWMNSQQELYEQMDEKERILDSETYLHEQHISEQKRNYIDKCTSMSLVRSITPFLDRALNEVERLSNGHESAEVRMNRIEYLLELIDKINQYNDTLSHWIKVRQGTVSLNIENFQLSPLFETLLKNRNSFEAKGITLDIQDTDLCIKADRTLTLFMMNTLMDNARKYTPEGGTVSLSAADMGDSVEIAISDTGRGLSEDDIRTILNEKVYDSSAIGMATAGEELKSQKGFGFGLMNCKGIIDKYKKTNQAFAVCRMNIESKLGEGSRFSFRLPKGAMKSFMLILMMSVSFAMNAQDGKDTDISSGNIIDDNECQYLLQSASDYADSIYYANIDGLYDKALSMADSSLIYLNDYCRLMYPDMKLKPLSLSSGNGYPDIEMWKKGIDIDYIILMDVRNESAVAALALNLWNIYEYNNNLYSRLYKLTTQDESLDKYCEDMHHSNINRQTGLIVFLLAVIVGLVVFLLTYYNRNIVRTFNYRQLAQLASNLFNSEGSGWLDKMCRDLNDIKPIDGVTVAVHRNDRDGLELQGSSNCPEISLLKDIMTKSYETNTKIVVRNESVQVLPMVVEEADNKLVGSIAVMLHGDGRSLSEDEGKILELMAKYVATYIYYADMKVEKRRNDLVMKEDEKIRTEREESAVHVQNMILDNCLSAIKHETMYYPSRIKTLVERMRTEIADGADVVNYSFTDIRELIQYYAEVFDLLSGQASKQLEKVMFRRKKVMAKELCKWAEKSIKKLNRRMDSDVQLQSEGDMNVTFLCDEDMLKYLVDSLLIAVIKLNARNVVLTFNYTKDKRPMMSVMAEGGCAVDVDKLFYADSLEYDDTEDTLNGVEWMICRQIVREHDEHTGKRGCRIYASNEDNGLIIRTELN